MCYYKCLVWACKHLTVGRRIRTCDDFARANKDADRRGGELTAAPCNRFSFHPLHSIGSPHDCDECKESKTATDTLIMSAHDLISQLRVKVEELQKREKERKMGKDMDVDMDMDEESVYSFDIIDLTARDI